MVVSYSMTYSPSIFLHLFHIRLAEERDVQGEVVECTVDVLTGLMKKHFPCALRFGVSTGKGFKWAGPRYVVKARAWVLPSYTRCTCYAFFKHKLLTKMLQATTS